MPLCEGYQAHRWLLWASFVCAFVPLAHCGFACLSNPCLYGICIDDINSTFSCYCIDGYTGVHCQTNWDECWSSPCQNGGTCLDGIANFNCTCSSGFQGELCEVNVNECESNPCHNNGTCIDGADGYTCACLPGFLGSFCEVDVSVCNATDQEHCDNGGVCIEGPGDTFKCICQPGWTGDRCEAAIDECASSPCENGGVCIDSHANYSCACPFGFTGRNCEIQLVMCGEASPCENGALCLTEDWSSVCYCVPDYHGDRCQFRYDECLLGPGCKNGGTCIDGVDEFTCSCPGDVTGDLCECLIIDDETQDCSYVRPTMDPTTVPFVPTIVPIASTIPPSETPIETTEVTRLRRTTMAESGSFPFTSTSTMVTTTFLPPSESSTFEFSELTTLEDKTSSVRVTDTVVEISTLMPPVASTEQIFTIPKMSTTTEKEQVPTMLPPSLPPVATDRPASITTEFPVLDTTSELFFPTASSTDYPTNCRKTGCQNGGMCLNTTTGLRCVCKAGWEGPSCEEKQSVKMPAFSGISFISHRLTNTSQIRVDITARTVAPAGIILHANLGLGIYMTLYLEDGLLKFKFSCGLQTMLLSEVQFHINNGYDLVATTTLEFPQAHRSVQHCVATVRVNNTLAMSGDQIARERPIDSAVTWLHLGGVPSFDDTEYPRIEGFMGCMHNLVVNMQARNIFKDASESNDIKECLSLACLSSPCFHGATCLDRNNSWTCQCPSGYVGVYCERSVCENNPCEFGGTCVTFPGSGFICLCPLGKHGQFCEYDLDIGHPVFSSSVGGLSSFSAHTLPAEIHQTMTITFKFIPHDMEQISLMLFVGQDGLHGPFSDHLAISFIKGYIVLTWNLGSGPRRIFTNRPIADLGHRPHLVQIGRDGQTAWLAVDNLGNITGKSPGPLTQLNTRSIVYLGGHDSANFSMLPHDLPLHTGFSGCLYDAKLQAGKLMLMLQQTRAITGRSVGQCGTSLCHEHACQNGGGCIHHGATYTCLCADGWFGPSCSMKFNPCDSSNHNCSEGSTCVPLHEGYSCDCPVGMRGSFCEIREELSDVRLSGIRSFIALVAEGLYQHQSCLDLEVKPTSNQGLVLFTGRSDVESFISLSLQGGVLELRVSTGKTRRRSGLLVIRSRRPLALERWNRVRAGRYGRRLFLWVEGAVNTGLLYPGETLPLGASLLYLGGVPDLSRLPPGSMAAHVTSFKGCVRRFASQWKQVQLNTSTIVAGRNLADCDGTACGGDVCYHGGTCNLDDAQVPRCNCTKEYLGQRCETQVSCVDFGCRNGGRCVHDRGPPRCSCPTGWGGPFCETETMAEAPHFGGDSFILIDRMAMSSKSENALTKADLDFVYLNYTTVRSNGMILWSSRENGAEYFGVGVENGLLKVVWAWEDEQPVEVVVPGESVADGRWHDLAISFSGNVSVWADHQAVMPQGQSTIARPLVTNGLLYMGGFPDPLVVATVTRGHFTTGFRGCVQKLAWSVDSVISNFSNFPGENIRSCDPFSP